MMKIEDTEAGAHLELLNNHIFLRNYQVVKEEVCKYPIIINKKTLILAEKLNPKNTVTIYFHQYLTPDQFNYINRFGREAYKGDDSKPIEYYVKKIFFDWGCSGKELFFGYKKNLVKTISLSNTRYHHEKGRTIYSTPLLKEGISVEYLRNSKNKVRSINEFKNGE